MRGPGTPTYFSLEKKKKEKEVREYDGDDDDPFRRLNEGETVDTDTYVRECVYW